MRDDFTAPALDRDRLERLSTAELVNAMLGALDEDEAWPIVNTLQGRGTRDVFQAAAALCVSGCSYERTFGARVLGQLSRRDDGWRPVFVDETVTLLISMLRRDEEPLVLRAALIALGHRGQRRCVGRALRLIEHADADVRYGLVHALSGHADPRATAGLIRLTRDEASHVRDWATFGLGRIGGVDNPSIRQALIDRLDDDDTVVRAEAIYGLAERRDARVVEAVLKEIERDDWDFLVMDALTEFPNACLLEALVELQGDLNEPDPHLDAAIRACRRKPRIRHHAMRSNIARSLAPRSG